MRTLIVLLTFLSLSTWAKAPHTDEIGGTRKSRLPAAADKVSEQIKPFEHYMDKSCRELVDTQSQDGFIKYFREKSKDIHKDICSIVGDYVMEEEMDVSQAERRLIGMGTFSNLLEAHYNEYVYEKGLEIYQNLDCKTMMDKYSDDGFIRYFATQMAEINAHLCDFLDFGSSQGMDNDRSQAEGPIGQGTYSKLIENYYQEYHYRQ